MSALQAAGAGVAISGAAPTVNQQQIITLPGGQQMAVRPAAVATPQMIQIPQPQMVQQMMQMQVPVSQNGQTVLQTVQMPVQTMAAPAAAPTYAQIPQLVQTSSGQQIVMQQVQIAQPQQAVQAAPQFAQIITPTGQIQQVQVLQGLGNNLAAAGQMVGGIQGIGGIQAISIPQQLGAIPSAGQNIQNQPNSSNASTLSNAVSSVSSSTTPGGNTVNPLLTPKTEPQEQGSDPEKTSTIASPTGAIVQPSGQPVQVMNMKNQQVVMQQTPAGTVAVQQSPVMSVRTANGQIVQV